MNYMHTRKVHIALEHPLYLYANSLANAALFMERQTMVAVSKPETE